MSTVTAERRHWLDAATTLVVALVAAAASYGHMLDVALMAGEPLWIARAFPITVDGLVLAALRRGEDGRPWLVLGVAVSVGCNVLAQFQAVAADAGPVVAAWPPIALYGTHRLLLRRTEPAKAPAAAKPKVALKPAVNGDAPRRVNGFDPKVREVADLAERLGKTPNRRDVCRELHVGAEKAGKLLAEFKAAQ